MLMEFPIAPTGPHVATMGRGEGGGGGVYSLPQESQIPSPIPVNHSGKGFCRLHYNRNTPASGRP